MSLEASMADLTSAIHALIAKLDGQSVANVEEKSPPSVAKVEHKPAPESDTDKHVEEFRELREALGKVDRDVAVSLLEKYGVKKVSAVKRGDYAALKADIIDALPEPEPEATEEQISLDDLRSALMKLGRAEGIAILAKYKAKKLSQLDEAHYADVLAAAKGA